VGRARYEMVAQCGAGGKPKLDLITYISRLIRGFDDGPTQEDGVSRLIYLCHYPKQCIFGQ
jgi:hypothetical protein